LPLNLHDALICRLKPLKTLPDHLGYGLRLLSIGLNPSLPSVAAGYYFANPRNRFWQALNASQLLQETLSPGPDAEAWLFSEHGIGFTDVVKRPTRGGSALRAADYRQGAPLLRDKIINYQPQIAWFHGKQAYQQYLRHAEDERASVAWGLQSFVIGSSKVFVTPNPSPANAIFSLVDLVSWYNELAKFLADPS
jgi:double-stranded uracil-DNA glycosylase